jgi:hypothetical protein
MTTSKPSKDQPAKAEPAPGATRYDTARPTVEAGRASRQLAAIYATQELIDKSW